MKYTIKRTAIICIAVLAPLLEGSLFMLLVSIYLLFYQKATIILKHYELREHTQLLEMQPHQYHALKEHIKQTSRLRHDSGYSVHLFSNLADKGDQVIHRFTTVEMNFL